MVLSCSPRCWVPIYAAIESKRLGHLIQMEPYDPRVLLRSIRHTRAVFALEPSQWAWIDELIRTANRWAHVPEITSAEVDRALDTMTQLLDSVGMPDGSKEAGSLRSSGVTQAQMPAGPMRSYATPWSTSLAVATASRKRA